MRKWGRWKTHAEIHVPGVQVYAAPTRLLAVVVQQLLVVFPAELPVTAGDHGLEDGVEAEIVGLEDDQVQVLTTVCERDVPGGGIRTGEWTDLPAWSGSPGSGS